MSPRLVCPCVGPVLGPDSLDDLIQSHLKGLSYHLYIDLTLLPSLPRFLFPSLCLSLPFSLSPLHNPTPANLTPLLEYINRASQTKHVQNYWFQTFSSLPTCSIAFFLIPVKGISILLISWAKNIGIIFWCFSLSHFPRQTHWQVLRPPPLGYMRVPLLPRWSQPPSPLPVSPVPDWICLWFRLWTLNFWRHSFPWPLCHQPLKHPMLTSLFSGIIYNIF